MGRGKRGDEPVVAPRRDHLCRLTLTLGEGQRGELVVTRQLEGPTRARRRSGRVRISAVSIKGGIFDANALVELHDEELKNALRSLGVKVESQDELTA